MELHEYFIKGKLYQFGGFPGDTPSIRHFIHREFGRGLRNWFYVLGPQNKIILEEKYFAQKGEIFLFLGSRQSETLFRGKNGMRPCTTVLKFLAPNNKIVLDLALSLSNSILEKWVFVNNQAAEF